MKRLRLSWALALLVAVALQHPASAQELQTGPGLKADGASQPDLVAALAPGILADMRGGAGSGAGRFYLNLQGGVQTFDRQRDFSYGTINTILGAAPAINVFHKDVDSDGGSGGFAAGYWVTDRIAAELGFNVSRNSARTEQPFTPPILSLGLFGFIDGRQRAGLGAVVAGGVTIDNLSPASWSLKYDQEVYDVHLDARYTLWESASRAAGLELVAGIAYLHVDQTFNNTVSGASGFGTTTRITTGIDLSDHLAGGRVGARGRVMILPNLSLTGEAFGEFYGRVSDLDATQYITNPAVTFFIGGGAAGTTTAPDFNMRQTASSRGFVPRVNVALALAYDITDNISIGLLYRFNALWNMSRPDMPTVVTGLPGFATTMDHGLRIRDDDRIYSHFGGGQIAVKF